MKEVIDKIILFLDIRISKTNKNEFRYQGNKKFSLDALKQNWYDVSEAIKDIKHEKLDAEGYYNGIQEHFKKKVEEYRDGIPYFNSLEDFVYWAMDKHSVYFDELGRIDTVKSKNDFSIVKLELLDYNEIAKEAKARTFHISSLEDVMAKVSFDIRKSNEERVKKELAFDPKASDAGFLKVIDRIIPGDKPIKKLHAEALKHLMWQVKRKMDGHNILDPLMLYVSGKQGQGKSSIIRHLFRDPLGHFYTEQDLGDALDVRSADTKRNHYFVLVDEMVNLNKSMVASLKKILTSSEESSRILGTNSVMLVKNNLTMAATSNYELTSTIYDETGLRRFWEIKFGLEAGEVVDWEELQKIDVMEMWRSVDESLEYGYYHRSLPTYVAMKAHQDSSIPKSYAHLFLYSQHYLVDSTENYAWMKVRDLFNAYKTWAKERDVKNAAHNIVWFENKLKSMGVQSKDFDRDTAYYLNNHKNATVEIIRDADKPDTAPVTMKTEGGSRLKRKDNVKSFQKDANIPFKESE